MLNGLAQESNGSPKRNALSMVFVLARKNLTEILEGLIQSKVFNIRVSNERMYFETLGRMSQQLMSISQKLSKLKIDVPEIKVPQTNITVTNPHDEKLAGEVKKASNVSVDQANKFRVTLSAITGQLENVAGLLRDLKITVPDIQTVRGKVEVSKTPHDAVFASISDKLTNILTALNNIHLEVPKQPEIKFPEMPKTISITEAKAIIQALSDLSEKIDELPKNYPSFDFPHSISVDNFPPVKAPTPVTHMSINSLGGFAKSRNITVNTNATPLPDEVLAYRRSLVVYNNSNQTLYVGGSDVTSTNGMPVPASSYSPAFDAGPKMIVYGIVASSTANVRVLELSDENSGR